MRVKIIAVGTKMPDWVEQGVAEYSKRMPQDLRVEFVELPLAKRGKNSDIKAAIRKEGEAMLAAIPRDDLVVALEVLGKPISTEKLAENIKQWQREGDNVSLLIGGPDGLAPECSQLARQKWSISAMTLPHPLVRVILAEQLYRACSINHNHPYHR